MNKINENLRFKSGIYAIFNLENGKRYVGSSVDLYNRLHEHYHNLKNNKAHNIHLQSAWNKYGEDKFIYCILEYCDKDYRFDREQYYINTLQPEYNLTQNVIANFGHSPSLESRQKISETLKKKYASGEIKTYRQQHAWIACWVYDLDYNFIKKFDCIADVGRFFKYNIRSSSLVFDLKILNKYCVFDHELNPEDVKNEIDKKFKKCLSSVGTYLISEDKFGNLTYHISFKECATACNISRRTLFKHTDMTRENPYIPPLNPNVKIYFSNIFIEHKSAVPLEESKELLSGNIGKGPIVDNTEINSENKESESLYSVENEPINRI